MKLLHISSENSWRGGEQQVAYLISELKNLGVNNVVLCKSGSAFENYCEEQEIKYYSAHFTSNLDLKTSLKLRNIYKSERPDLIHAHSSRSHSMAVYSTYFGIDVPIIVSRRVDFPIKTTWKYDHNSVKKIICVSDFIKKMVIEKIKNQEKCITIHSGIDIHKFEKIANKSLLPEFGFDISFKAVGNTSAIADHKDYFTFVDTAEVVLKQRKDVVFFIIGDGPMRSQIDAYIKSKNLGSNVIMTGFRSDIAEILPALDCFLMTSKTEGLGTSLLDAMAAGIPIVATKGGGIPEIVIHGKTGLLSDPGDFSNLADNINSVLDNKNLASSLIAEGNRFIHQFSYQEMGRQTYKEYLSVIH